MATNSDSLISFRSNECVAIHVQDLKRAEYFYSEVLKFRLEEKTVHHLMYDTGHFKLFVNLDINPSPPIPSFSVKNVKEAKAYLIENGCVVVRDGEGSLYFKDPNGIVFDIIERI